ncbi:MAG: T9SS type A sorting domain-containing protein [Bacteroidota bacterium]
MTNRGTLIRFLPPYSNRIFAHLLLLTLPALLPTVVQAQCGPGACKGPNLIFNGNFEVANPDPNNPIYGFTTEFGTVLCPPVNFYDLWGSVTVQNNPSNCFFEWVSYDHSLGDGSGSMLVADFPDTNPNGTNNPMDIWATQVTVEPGKTYCFGAWFMNLNNNPNKSLPNFRYMVDNILIGISPDLPTSGNWEYYAFTYTVPAGVTQITLSLENGKFGGQGNDLAIDDIEFAELVNGVLPPTANDDAVVIQPTAVNFPINVIANDYVNSHTEVLDTASLVITAHPPANQGTVTTNQYGEVFFTPAPGYLGTVTFKYGISQLSGCMDEAVVTISVDNILPVEYSNLGAEWMGDHSKISWTTSREENNFNFLIQRSLDNNQFVTIGERGGAGTSSTRNEYSFEDYNVAAMGIEKAYYRIKQIDLNGSFSLSQTMVLTLENTDLVKMQAYPNPASTQQPIVLDYTNETGRDLTLQVLNVNGVVVHQQRIDGGLAPQAMQLNLQHLSPGIYLLSMADREIKASQRLIITN